MGGKIILAGGYLHPTPFGKIILAGGKIILADGKTVLAGGRENYFGRWEKIPVRAREARKFLNDGM